MYTSSTHKCTQFFGQCSATSENNKTRAFCYGDIYGMRPMDLVEDGLSTGWARKSDFWPTLDITLIIILGYLREPQNSEKVVHQLRMLETAVYNLEKSKK
ncbi:hypothetical protein E2986_12334 [Frieseomelitta varia]|uniref:Uncharacterized protein n=1 Tax=Frieseomelitta varia TaxID=561572 RepID=A0A833RPI7_9HYME|nr:hypothetical protein E2986_12334 [Frieseomelitta varia]